MKLHLHSMGNTAHFRF